MSKKLPTIKKFEEVARKKGLSQDRLAKLADIANNTVIKIEQGAIANPRLDTLKKITKVLDVSIDGLINEDEKVVGREAVEL